jgi:hypothetical protein
VPSPWLSSFSVDVSLTPRYSENGPRTISDSRAAESAAAAGRRAIQSFGSAWRPEAAGLHGAAKENPMAKARVWLSFDLGVRGDFQGMYEFLDAYKAKECGNSVGVFSFDYQNDLVVELTAKLQEHVDFDKRSRVYVIFPREGKHVGRFIVGKRKAPPWAGYATSEAADEDDES